MPEIITIGEILVEVMSTKVGQKFNEVGLFEGPFPSGAPAIFIDQAAKIGSTAGIVSVVGKDDFGRINIDKLKADGVNVDYIRETPQLSTGVAFVTYDEEGNREFIFHLNNSAAGLLNASDIQESMFDNCKYFHVMGTSIINDGIRQAVLKAIEFCKRKNIIVSFDPNIRVELLDENDDSGEMLREIYEQADIFLPSENELEFFVGGKDEKESAQMALASGKKYIVVKKGKKGSSGYSANEEVHLDSYLVEETDPTGAGDCFGGTFISCLNQGMSFKTSLEYANLAGALAVTKKGPMSGNSTILDLDSFKSNYEGGNNE